MLLEEWIFTIVNTIIAGAGFFLTWREYRKTKTIKETIEETIHREQYLIDRPELLSRLDQCSRINLTSHTLLSSNIKFTSSLRYVIASLEHHFSEKDSLYIQVQKISERFNSLAQNSDKANGVDEERSEFGLMISDLQALIKTGRN